MGNSTPPERREQYQPGLNVTTFALPASWEDMEALGLDPLTGHPTEPLAEGGQ